MTRSRAGGAAPPLSCTSVESAELNAVTSASGIRKVFIADPFLANDINQPHVNLTGNFAQLTAEERLGHMYATPGPAIGGVRASLWDQSMPLTASALGLLTLTDTLESLEAIGARNGNAAGRP